MTLPLITLHDLALGLEGYCLVHLILLVVNQAMKQVYKQVVNTHELQVLYAHTFNKRTGKHHKLDSQVCHVGDCGTIKLRSPALMTLWHYPEEPLTR